MIVASFSRSINYSRPGCRTQRVHIEAEALAQNANRREARREAKF